MSMPQSPRREATSIGLSLDKQFWAQMNSWLSNDPIVIDILKVEQRLLLLAGCRIVGER
jgi:hypothetical protein